MGGLIFFLFRMHFSKKVINESASSKMGPISIMGALFEKEKIGTFTQGRRVLKESLGFAVTNRSTEKKLLPRNEVVFQVQKPLNIS